MTLVRIRATGQVLEMVPHAANAMIDGGTAELVLDETKGPKTETTTAMPRSEKAVGPGQNPPKRKGK